MVLGDNGYAINIVKKSPNCEFSQLIPLDYQANFTWYLDPKYTNLFKHSYQIKRSIMKKFIIKKQPHSLKAQQRSKSVFSANAIKALFIALLFLAGSGFTANAGINPSGKIHKTTHHHLRKCWACNGSGKCSSCSGTGQKTCWHCAGSGTIRDYYNDKTSTCNVCGGKGTLRCGSCDASGLCSTCHGTGVLDR